MIRSLTRTLLCTLLLFATLPAWAGSPLEEACSTLARAEGAALKAAIEDLAALNDGAALGILEALRDRRLRVDPEGPRLLILEGEDGTGEVAGAVARDALTGAPVAVADKALRAPVVTNAIRRVLLPAIARLELSAPDPARRLAAAEELAKRAAPEARDTLRQALGKEKDPAVRTTLHLALAQLDLADAEPARRLEALAVLAGAGDGRHLPLLQALLATDADGNPREADAGVRAAAARAVNQIERRALLVNQAGNLFYGLSLGSILLLAALGLAITFGLMGVINMAHGEMLMVGAYATYGVQGLFQTYLPGWEGWYLAAALPVAFAVTAVLGMALERLIIRHLYGRPLETLLATWGISLMLIQSVRLVFGAQNVQVANPPWLSGGWEVASGLVLPYNRMAIVAFTLVVVAGVWAVLARTRLGLEVRAITQNRAMAAALGVRTARVDMWTFGLGAGVAGLGGVALSQVGNVGPELGQAYIVDSFMVVVLGGVGKLAGTVAGALGLGMANKFLEPVAGAVLGKILLLAFIILFIQKRPQGLFALKGRSAEA